MGCFGFGWGFPWTMFWVIVGLAFWILMPWRRGALRRNLRNHSDDVHVTPSDILRERFAKGEIDEKEYKSRMEVLKKE